MRFRFHTVTWCGFAVVGLMVTGCSLGDPAVRPEAEAPASTTPATTPAQDDTVEDAAEDAAEDAVENATGENGVAEDGERDRADLADLSGLPGELVRRTFDGGLVVSTPDGSNERELAPGGAALNTQPTWSASGDRIAWSALDADGAELLIANVADDSVAIETREAVLSPAFYMAWSAADSWIAGLRNGGSGIELIMIDAATGDVRVVGPGQPFFTDWVNNDELVAVIGGTVLADIPAVGEATQRGLGAPLGVFQAPVALADATIVAFDDGQGGNTVTRITAEVATPLATADGPVIMAADPQGTRLAVVVPAAGVQSEVISFQTNAPPTLPAGQVSIIDLETGAVTTLPETNVAAISWSPNGETLALLQVSADDATWRFVTGDRRVDGTTFVPSREFASAYLPFADQYERSSTWWSPDSSAFVLSGSVDGEDGVWVDRIDDELAAVRIGSGDIAFWSPQ